MNFLPGKGILAELTFYFDMIKCRSAETPGSSADGLERGRKTEADNDGCFEPESEGSRASAEGVERDRLGNRFLFRKGAFL